MEQQVLYIDNPSVEFLQFLKEQREEKEKREQELLRLAGLLFPEKECPTCDKNPPQTLT